MSARFRFTYEEAFAAMQAGVAAEAALHGGTSPDQTPKHLRVGVNSAMVDSASLADLLIRKGVITQDEYVQAITEGMNREVERYEAHLSQKTGRPVALAPHTVDFGEPPKGAAS